jgi:FkbM family methyltransferase
VNFQNTIRQAVVRCVTTVLGKRSRMHRIPFGPLRGKKICTIPQISLRMYWGIDEPWVAAVARENIRPGDIVYDIGAHIGYTALLFAKMLGGTGSVHAFELLPSTAEQFLTKSVRANEFKNIHIHPVGLGEREATIELPVGPTHMSTLRFEFGDEYVETYGRDVCKIVTLDGYTAAHSLPAPSLMKIDIEGAEVGCLKGARKIIQKHGPKLMVAFHNADLLREGCALLTSWGYKVTARDGTVIDRKYLNGVKRFHDNVLCLRKSLGSQIEHPCKAGSSLSRDAGESFCE